MTGERCRLALEDGSVFAGDSFGARGTASAEVVFNTALTGYQEILTDPSYCGQIVTMTATQIGNYGVNPEDVESTATHLSGFVVKELSRLPSNHRARGTLAEYLRAAGVIGLAGVDTRAITRRLRERGALRGVISTEIDDPRELVERARGAAPMEGQDLVQRVMPIGETIWPGSGPGARRVVALDCGIKHNMLRILAAAGCEVIVLRGDAATEAILDHKPDGVLIGNGPGDPAAVQSTVVTLRGLLGRVPILGICLGHQLLALAVGARTYKLKTGHHGTNHPVLNLDTGRVEITSQNHGFAVDPKSLQAVGGRATHRSLYDGSLEGFAHPGHRLLAVQYHPEAAPGPHDSRYVFDGFVDLMGQSLLAVSR